MNRRIYEIVVVGVVAIALAAWGASALAKKDEPAKQGDHKEHSEVMAACAKACSDCQRECDSCATHCARLTGEGKKDHLTTLMTCQDCASLCAAAAQIVARSGPFSDTVCAACAEACARCGKACGNFPDDKHMKECSEECLKCEKACRDMVKHLGGK